MTLNPSSDLASIRQQLRSRLPADPLTEGQQAEVARLLPKATAAARKLANRWHCPAADLESCAAEFLVDAVREFDGRGNLDAFVCQRIRQRLIDEQRQRSVIRDYERPMSQDHSYNQSPSYNMELAEAAHLVRRCLDSRDVDILRYRLAGLKPSEIASLLQLSLRRVQELWADIERAINHHAKKAELTATDLATAVLDCDGSAAEKFSKIFRAF